MEINKVYIAGKVTGRNYDEAYAHFEKAEIHLRNHGFDVMNPMKMIPRDTNWVIAMKILIPALMKCDAIYMLEGFRESQGANFEAYIALTLGYPIDYETKYLPFQNFKCN